MSTTRGVSISVCLLTYNHVATLRSTLRSALNQTLEPYEIIVSDDCSTDGTWQLIIQLAERDPRLQPIRTPQNSGMAANANFAVSHSSRPYLALLHHDDLYREDMLEKWLAVMESHPDVGFVFNAYGLYGSSRVYGHPLASGRIDGKLFLAKFLFPSWGCPVRGTALIRTDLWRILGGMREQFGLLADVDLWMRLAASTAVGYVPEPLITIRHERPEYYPEIYKTTDWSWRRQRYLYDIHALNRLSNLKLTTFKGLAQWSVFRFRLSTETAKWLAYAVVRRRWNMISTCADSITPYDQPWLRVLRSIVCLLARLVGANTSRSS